LSRIPNHVIERYRKPQAYRQRNGETVTVLSWENRLFAKGWGFEDEIVSLEELKAIIKGVYVVDYKVTIPI